MRLRNQAVDSILALFKPGRSFVLTSHARPDGDAVGSLLAAAELLDQLGCTCDVVLADPVPTIFDNLPRVRRIRQGDAFGSHEDVARRAAIILECDSIERTGLLGLEGRLLINIDHHASGRAFGTLNWIDSEACAVGLMIYHLALAAGAEITASMATCLYSAILSDTGAFTSQSTTADTLGVVAELARRGAKPGQIAHDLLRSSPECRIRLLGSSLVNMQRRGAIAWSWATLDDLERLQANAEDCEGVVNYLIAIAGVEAAFFLRELPDTGEFRLSLRSKSRVDVSQIAESFGGGGHRVASACTLSGSLAGVIDQVLERVQVHSVSLT